MQRTTIVLIWLIASLVLSACGLNNPLPSGPANSSDGGVVTIGFATDEYQRQVYEPLIETFHTENPNIRVQLISIDELRQTHPNEPSSQEELIRQILSAADTAALTYIDPATIDSGYLFDLVPLMEADPTFDQDDLYPLALTMSRREQAIYSLPHILPIQFYSYNQDLWDTHNLPAPTPDWTWDDALAVAEQLATRRGDQVETYGMVGWELGILTLINELSKAGVDVLRTPAEQVRLDEPAIAAALERVIALGDAGVIYRPPRDAEGDSANSDDFQKIILDGRAGIWSADLLYYSPEQTVPSFTVGTAAFPNVTSFPLPLLFGGSQGYVISRGTAHPQESWRWIEFLSRQNLDQSFNNPAQITTAPARKSVAEASGYWEQLDPEKTSIVQTFLEQPAPAFPVSLFSQQVSVFEPLITALEAAQGGKPIDEALQEAQAQLDERIAEVALTPEPTPDTRPIVVATQVPNVAPAGATVVRFSGFGLDNSIFRPVAREFNQSNTENVFVEVVDPEPSDEGYTLTSIAATSDCFIGFGGPLQEEITATLDLQPLLDADAGFDSADYPAAFLEPFRQGNGLYGLPFLVNLNMLHYNQTAFDAAGLAYPTIDWTPDDFLNAAQQLTSGTGADKQYGYGTPGMNSEDIRFFLDRFGAELTLGEDTAIRPNFTDPQVLAALNYYVDLLRTYSPHTKIDGYRDEMSESNPADELIYQGKLGMWFDFSYGFSMGGEEDFVLAVAPLPIGDTPLTPNDFNIQGMHISATTEQPQACWSWLKHLSSNTSAISSYYGNSFPARTSVATSEAFLAQAEVGAAEVFIAYSQALERAPRTTESPNSTWRGDIDYYWFYYALDQALQGEADLEQALAEAQTITEDYLACVRNETEAYVCATQLDPDYKGFNQPLEGEPVPISE